MKYRTGNQMVSDYYSRHPKKENKTLIFTEDYANFLAFSAVPDSMTLAEIAATFMPQSQIIRSPADVSDLQASGRFDTSEPVAVR
ncbi:hypothetical protein DPMN_182943 [Dreissena polymorpha]|uniref:Uncharacterized protein n=1 Tax=Dreissena polymorpha TaxID=45954 RepID=A0A9D4I6M6_DREPO|nr:hypothetical protein DPMN_182943 [Dreissena polymorpha]